jgi:hypothetical protein
VNSLPPALPDPQHGGQSATGRLLNQQTGDYVMQADGRLQGMSTVNQLVLLAIRNTIDLSALTEKGPNFAQALTALVQVALAPLIAQKLVGLQSVQVLDGSKVLGLNPSAGIAVVNWVDLTTGQPQATNL